MTAPLASLSIAVDMRTGIRSPAALVMWAVAVTMGLPVASVPLRAHARSQMLARKTSRQGRPMASCLRTPVIRSAARLNVVIRQSGSTVKTPSLMESRMGSGDDIYLHLSVTHTLAIRKPLFVEFGQFARLGGFRYAGTSATTRS